MSTIEAALTAGTGQAPSDSRLTLSSIMSPQDTNLMGTVHGGVILKLIDSVAGVVAARHSQGPAVTASMDETVFLAPVRVGDVAHVDARITWAGRTSMEVAVTVTADRWNETVPATTVATAHLVMVAVDDNGNPRPVPPVVPVSQEDRLAWREAEIRRTHRLALRASLSSKKDDNAA
ncbi:acyl-CoA thioesterase [Stackebrandtia nassauensis]|uniref:Thioesterase superfamily protein n=1 Tax=Stackebrandtia nassauensis (strain DSM 44728 / CIP 108903 / NRRL B-16338 / NBRC 102104 / LLR-40K-21) TaxID=446470 RepID=D3Q324_STANL|nr:acyl-CoA thioesterase [Stackebrandtia nassauensis]ADD39994.1 thioesterase superfamily protein [Stackebrandtia nassauensis DSM 44728]